MPAGLAEHATLYAEAGSVSSASTQHFRRLALFMAEAVSSHRLESLDLVANDLDAETASVLQAAAAARRRPLHLLLCLQPSFQAHEIMTSSAGSLTARAFSRLCHCVRKLLGSSAMDLERATARHHLLQPLKPMSAGLL